MAKGCKIALLLGLVPALTGATLPDLDTLLLAAHNRERAMVGVPAMHWDAGLAADAREWAAELAATGQFEHFDEVSDDPDAQGENLWMGTRGAFSPETMVGHWAGEKKDFVQGTFPANSRTGNLEDVGHYTQMVWRDTRSMGCAIVPNAEDDYLVCRYAASGNVVGEQPF
jgi:hypothetical protein